MSQRKENIRKGILGGILLFTLVALIAGPLLRNSENKKDQTAENAISGSGFRQDGSLTILGRQGQVKEKVSIEIAADDQSRTKGLMFRSTMDEGNGMLFIFPDERERSFWMKNTPLPLDILYISADSTIVHIAKNTVPYSESGIYSFKPAKYVLEVNAGYAERNNIAIGDRVRFSRK